MEQTILAQARRLYHHVVNGGKLKPEDVSYMVSALEKAYTDEQSLHDEPPMKLDTNKERKMTLPTERTNAVLRTERFLIDLLDPKKTPRVPRAVRQEAGRLLKHYPTKYDMEYMEESFEYKA